MGDGISVWLLAGAALGMVFVLLQQVVAAQKRLARVEGKLDTLLKNAGLQYDPFFDVSDDVADAVRSGDKMLAVKLYRDAEDCGLREAKERIDDLFRQSGFGVATSGDGARALLIVGPTMVVCGLAGSLLPLLVWMPDPGSYMLFVATLPGGIVGLFAGLTLGILIFRKVQRRRLNSEEGASGDR